MAAHPCYTHTNHPAFFYEDMLADPYRMQSYRRAINQMVNAGDIVADLGTGMGVLAMMAVQAGAKHVYAVEVRDNVIPVAQRLIDRNGMSDKITLVHGDAQEVQLNASVDLIINELIGDFGTDENILECVKAFAAKHLKENGKVLPESLRTYLVPVQYGNEFRGIWYKGYQGLDLSPANEYACHEEAVMRILTQQPVELATPNIIESIQFNHGMPERTPHHSSCFTVHSPGELQGFMGFFQADLTEGVRLDNYPGYAECHWQTWHWPIYPPKQVQPAQQLQCELHAIAHMIAQGWRLDWSMSD